MQAMTHTKELEQNGTCTIVSRKSVTGDHVIPSTWDFKVKRFPCVIFRKFKARLCARSDRKLEGVHYFEKYYPVVPWTTVRLMLSLNINQVWATRQVYFSNASVQATL